MKHFILIAVLAFATTAATAQGRYYTLPECGGDSLKYIEHNYEDNQNRYTGKTMAYFVGECELKLEDFFPSIYVAMEGVRQEDHGKVTGIYFEFYQGNYEYTVYLAFAPPYPYNREDFNSVENSDYDEPWQQKYYNFFKNYIIQKIYIIKSKDGKSLKNYRRP